MKLSEELVWRGLYYQTTLPDIESLDLSPITFYWGVDPSADSMTVGNLASAMLVKALLRHGHRAVLLVGGATGLIGDPDGKSRERDLINPEQIKHNKTAITAQYRQLFGNHNFEVVDNYQWFKDYRFLDFLRDVGKHVPMRQMLARDFVTSRLGESGNGISYAEFSYVLIQAYDFLWLYRNRQVTLQVCGADQWGNSIAGVDLIRRATGEEAHVYSVPLIINQTTGVKFGKSEAGAVWLDGQKTSPTAFYQFWINLDDAGVEDYLKIYSEMGREQLAEIMARHKQDPAARLAQKTLAAEVTRLVHGEDQLRLAQSVSAYLTGDKPVGQADEKEMIALRQEVHSVKSADTGSVAAALVAAGLAESNGEARRLIAAGAVRLNNQKLAREQFIPEDFVSGRVMLRRGKAYKDSVLVEREKRGV